MTQINTFEELLEQLDANPEWKVALRDRILSEELQNLPTKFDAFAKNTSERMNRLEGDMGTIKGNQARTDTIERAYSMAADLQMVHRRNLGGSELNQLAESALQAGMSLNQDVLRSFRRADLVIQAERNGEFEYIAAEISWTADSRDSNRAIRNAGIIRAATGRPCTAAVAGVRNTSQVQELADSGAIHWHPLEDRSPAQAEE